MSGGRNRRVASSERSQFAERPLSLESRLDHPRARSRASPAVLCVAAEAAGRASGTPGRRVTVSYMPRARQFSARLDAAVVDRLERRGARGGLNKSRLAERYIDEGMRMEDHPGIVFRDGPTGRRAGLAGGPDVWEVIAATSASGLVGEQAIAAAAEWGNLTPAQVRVAVRYYGEYRAEIDELVRRNVEEADAAEERWRREQNALA